MTTLVMSIGQSPFEQAIILMLDEDYRLLGQEHLGQCNPDCVALPISALIGRASSLGASAIILAHNHPSGILEPSESDLSATAAFEARAAEENIQLIDHWLVTSKDCRSIMAASRNAKKPLDLEILMLRDVGAYHAAVIAHGEIPGGADEPPPPGADFVRTAR